MNNEKRLDRVGEELMALQDQIERMTPFGQDRSHLFGEVVVAVLEKLDQVDWTSPHRLIRRIARNKRVDMIRRAKTRSHQSLESLSHSLPDFSTGPDSAPIEELIAHLPEDEQAFLLARFRDGKSWVEIAEEAKCSEGTIRSRWHRLKQRLTEDNMFQAALSDWS